MSRKTIKETVPEAQLLPQADSSSLWRQKDWQQYQPWVRPWPSSSMMRRGRLRYTERGREALLLFSSEALGTFIFPQRKRRNGYWRSYYSVQYNQRRQSLYISTQLWNSKKNIVMITYFVVSEHYFKGGIFRIYF